jgi:hypothetical protein
MRNLFLILILSFWGLQSQAQLLFTESFAVILDTNKKIQGSIIPDFKYQTQKENLIELENLANISVRFRRSAITFANKIEFSKYGKNVFLSGGFLYTEYRQIFERKFALEPYVQLQWAEARGLEWKHAQGLNFRWIPIKNERIGLFIGSGPFHEYERWSYKAVPDERLPIGQTGLTPIANNKFKLGSYVSFKYKASEQLFIDLSGYHQAEFDKLFNHPRLGSSSSANYKFTEHLGLILTYQNIYDFQPIVPIDKLFNRIIFTINISF